VPSAKSAAPNQPITRDSLIAGHSDRFAINAQRRIGVLRRAAVFAIGVTVVATLLLPAQTILASSVATTASPGRCPGWNSTTRPPDYIRVLRRATGRVQRVPFKRYVITVMGKEWPSYLPQTVVEAGAVAVKQFAWFHSLGSGRLSHRGQCFDVTDGIGDQLYKPGRARISPDHYAAVAKTWDVRLLKNGALFMTGYRTGSKGRCGHDVTGWKLYARSSVRCAQRGLSYLQILRRYYGPVAVVAGGGGSSESPNANDSRSAGSPGQANSPDAKSSSADTQTSSTNSSDKLANDSGTPSDTSGTAQTNSDQADATTHDVPRITCEAGMTGGVGLDVDSSASDAMPIGELAFTQG